MFWNFPDFAGDGNGFKMGGGSPAPAVGHVLRNTIAFRNAAHGVTDNGNTGKSALTRNTTWAIAGTGFDADTPGAAATLTGPRSADGTLPSAPALPRAAERRGRRRPLLSRAPGPGRVFRSEPVSDSPIERLDSRGAGMRHLGATIHHGG